MNNWYARIVNGRQVGVESRLRAAEWAAASITTGTLDTAICWTDTDPIERGLTRRWQLRPITDEAAAAWKARHPREGGPPCDA